MILVCAQYVSVSIQGLHPLKDMACEAVAYVDGESHTEGPTSVVK